ncbi:activating signal cointegrator 1 complex subunit 1-like [Convolutriloba macropyga]|uniref:activating signal cointegrator 1 complex subunit 1-like n=1 Tax=Convolutriloba macropyga TaxID=536237 RepID=UPI003F51F6EC
MDVLAPELLLLPNGSVYRVNPTYDSSINMKPSEIEDTATSFEPLPTRDDFETCQVDFTDLKRTIDCPPLLLKYVIGKGGEKKREIEQETKTRVTIPDRKFPDNPIVVQGLSSVEMLNSAITRIQLTMERGRAKEPFTHFVSIPVVNLEILERFEAFKESVMSAGFVKSRRIEDTLFQKPQKMHITVATLALLSKNEVKEAVEVMNNLHSELSALVGDAKMSFTLNSLEIMNDDPSSADVLYAKVNGDSSVLLQVIVDTIYERFSNTGYLQKSFDRESVKMHVTLMNSRFRGERVTQQSNLGSNNSEETDDKSFDVGALMENLADYEFGSFEVDKIHLSQRYSTNAKTGYYSDSCILTLK